MEINDIQKENGKFVITFASTETGDDIMEIKVNKSDIKQIAEYYNKL